MPLPGNVATVTVRGTLTNVDGTPSTGHVRIFPPGFIVDVGENVILTPDGVTVPVDPATGEWEVTVPASDDPGLNPFGFTYTVDLIAGYEAHREYVFLPAAVPVVDYAGLVKVDTPSCGEVSVSGIPGPRGLPGTGDGSAVPPFVQTFVAAATTWEAHHDRGVIGTVDAYDPLGRSIPLVDVVQNDEAVSIVAWYLPTAGKLVVS